MASEERLKVRAHGIELGRMNRRSDETRADMCCQGLEALKNRAKDTKRRLSECRPSAHITLIRRVHSFAHLRPDERNIFHEHGHWTTARVPRWLLHHHPAGNVY